MAEETRSTERVNSTELTEAFVVRILSRQKAKFPTDLLHVSCS